MGEVTGRAVDIEIVPRSHAILSASSAERWLVCTPSARIEEQIVDEDSGFAKDGTAAHAFAELRLRYLLKQVTKPEYLAAYEATETLYQEVVDLWELSDWEAIDTYVQYVMDEAVRLEAEVFIEARVSYTKYAQEGFGTSDALLVSRKKRIIKSVDLKFGKGIPVNATGNVQAKLYALGGLIAYDPSYEFENVEWAIVQPRLDYIGEDSDTVADLVKWAEEVVAPAAEKAWKGEGNLVPTAKGCRFCKVAASCRARIAENVLIARRDFVEINEATPEDIRLEEYLMDPDEIARILPQIDGWITWANQFKAHALVLARDKGVKLDGYKVVRGRAIRSWKPDVDVVEALRDMGISDDVIFPPPPPKPTPRSVSQLEKTMGKKPFGATVAPKLVYTPPGKPALVPEADQRPAINAAEEAKEEFKSI